MTGYESIRTTNAAASAPNPPAHFADLGLVTAAGALNANGVANSNPPHPGDEATHNVSCTITDNNPATSGDPTCLGP